MPRADEMISDQGEKSNMNRSRDGRRRAFASSIEASSSSSVSVSSSDSLKSGLSALAEHSAFGKHSTTKKKISGSLSLQMEELVDLGASLKPHRMSSPKSTNLIKSQVHVPIGRNHPNLGRGAFVKVLSTVAMMVTGTSGAPIENNSSLGIEMAAARVDNFVTESGSGQEGSHVGLVAGLCSTVGILLIVLILLAAYYMSIEEEQAGRHRRDEEDAVHGVQLIAYFRPLPKIVVAEWVFRE